MLVKLECNTFGLNLTYLVGEFGIFTVWSTPTKGVLLIVMPPYHLYPHINASTFEPASLPVYINTYSHS